MPPAQGDAPTPSASRATVSAADVDAAAERLQGLVSITPLTRSRRLSEATGAKVLLKREDLQPVRSYKNRGAINLISQLAPGQRDSGVVCASAGNHAQGVAFACSTLEVPARIFLPRTTPRQKRDRVAAIGGDFVEIVVSGSTYDAAAAAAAEDAEQTGATLVPAFDHPMTIAGQGTVTREIVGVIGHAPDVLVVPVGGGGLLAGSLAWLREQYPYARVVGVEPAGAASMAAALVAGSPVTLEDIDPFVDGAAVRRVGDHTFPIVRDGNAELVSVPEGAVCQEMLAMYQTEGIITEPAGALAAAALPSLGILPDQTVVVVVSGGNNDVLRYAEVVERALVHEGRKHYFLVDFPQEPGALRGFLRDVLGPDDDIALFEYTKRNNRETGPALVGIELGSRDDLRPLLDRMARSPIEVEPIPPDSPLFRFIL
ncbi:threonine ammonia-lyase IlvA [Ornithinimicrobium sp. F0845]|uniref:threonine ammonia-lyase IlvA n=1 Tax=Ornithinimicrobium sp. F0845 TaxID=2926412 RepID=UPI001FF45B1A|nr:threonine ammonia-lyase IlvA [Ornithinimicrobium sp. F0845]MCK0112924.1 threonine ammonia-lyase IlvA [Ornithinimicrobium sp. F0845]